MNRIRKSIAEGLFLLDVRAQDMVDVFEQAVDHVIQLGHIPAALRGALVDELTSREERSSTAIGQSVAVPHAYVEGEMPPMAMFVRLRSPLNQGAPDGVPTRFVFVLMGPPGQAGEHLDTLTAIARLMSDDEFRYEARTAQSQQELIDAVDHFIDRTSPDRPQESDELPGDLEYTGRLGGGLWADIQRRRRHYWTDFTDGLHPKSISSILFMFFACLAPAITFGELMADVTGGMIGATEMLVVTAIGGVLYALFAGQPLILLAGIGPLLVFTGVLYEFCGRFGWPFLPTYAWVGLWTGVFTILLALTDASCLLRWFTRFTDEIFAALITIIFIVEAAAALMRYVKSAHLDTLSHDVALLSIILMTGTFLLAMALSQMRRTVYLRPLAREFLSDLGPTIAIILMYCFALLFSGVQPETMNMPEQLGPSVDRAWFINLFDAPKIVWFGSIVPALLVTVLIFMNQNITARLVNSRDHHLTKGAGYHLDLAVVGGLVGVSSLFGLPWLTAATVRSINHLRSLATVEEKVNRAGESREQVIHVRENRFTALVIHLLIGLSLTQLGLLSQIPKAILYGLFLFMGVASIAGNQFFERMLLWIMDPALYPRTHYIRKVPAKVLHLFTLMQLGLLAILWVIKASALGILFPLFIALLVPIRFLCSRYFLPKHLEALDGSIDPNDEREHWN